MRKTSYRATVKALRQGDVATARAGLERLARSKRNVQLFASAASYGLPELQTLIRAANTQAARNSNRTWVTY